MGQMTVYESEDSGCRNRRDLERFETSIGKLDAAGIPVKRVECSSPDDIPEGEARDNVAMMGMGCLPVAEYDGVCIAVGAYPTDQELVDFLDVPESVLGIARTGPPAASNDMTPHCFLRPRTF